MLVDKTALVTGSSRGIGRAIAESFADHGADVAVNHHPDDEPGDAVVSAVEGMGSEAIDVGADISDPDDAEHLVGRTRDELGDVDVLVNNAGIFPRESWGEMDRAGWDRVVDVNLGGLFEVSHRVLPAMADRGDGAVVNMASTWGLQGGTVDPAYTASKGGIVAVTRQMCHAFAADGVRVNAISPGAVKTDLNADLREDDEYVTDVREAVPAGRFGEPSDVAAVATFLASDMAAYVHGENVVVDGGATA
jgi:NAD(P)-dependent dehydrogenase (short-subunit alcohol dehydrogenase family)